MNTPTLAELLERGHRAPLARAALSLLLGLFGLWDRVDVVERWYEQHAERGAHPSFALVRWHVVAADADRGDVVPMSPGERAVLLLAASLATGHRVDLAELLPLLDDTHGATLTMAVYSALRGRDPVTSEWDGLRFAGQEDRDQVDELVAAGRRSLAEQAEREKRARAAYATLAEQRRAHEAAGRE